MNLNNNHVFEPGMPAAVVKCTAAHFHDVAVGIVTRVTKTKVVVDIGDGEETTFQTRRKHSRLPRYMGHNRSLANSTLRLVHSHKGETVEGIRENILKRQIVAKKERDRREAELTKAAEEKARQREEAVEKMWDTKGAHVWSKAAPFGPCMLSLSFHNDRGNICRFLVSVSPAASNKDHYTFKVAGMVHNPVAKNTEPFSTTFPHCTSIKEGVYYILSLNV